MVQDQHNIFISDLVFQEMHYEMFTMDRGHVVHDFKFEVWKQSMQLRAMMDLFFQLFVTFYFQFGLIEYNKIKLESVNIGGEFLALNKEDDEELYNYDLYTLKKDFSGLANKLYSVMGISLLNLLMPISMFGEYILVSKTNRARGGYDGEFMNELALFVLTLIGWNDMVIRFTSSGFSPDNLFNQKIEDMSRMQVMSSNIIWAHISPD